MSLGKKKETSKSTNVTTPTNPAWMTGSVQGLQDRINTLGGQDPWSFVPGASSLQQQAFSGAAGLGTSPYYGQAAGLANLAANGGANTAQGFTAAPAAQAAAGSASAGKFTDLDLQGYLNPFMSGVVDASMADFDAYADSVRAKQRAASAWNGGVRNSNNAILQAQTEAELARARNTSLSNLRSDAFNRASAIATGDLDRAANVSTANAGYTTQTNLANANATNQGNQFNASAQNAMSQFNAGQQDNALARLLQSAGVLANVGQAQNADERANIQTQWDLGEAQREIERQKLAAPLDLAEWQAMMMGQMPYNLFTGQTSTGTGTTTQTGFNLDLMKLGQAVAGAAKNASGLSDGRLKQDVVPLGEGPSGDMIYGFNYLGQDGPPQYVGPMAQEVALTHPEAVSPGPGGFMSVDYNALGLPSPTQQDAARLPSLAADEDPLGGWSGGTAQSLRQMQQQPLPGGDRPNPRLTRQSRGLFRGRA